MNKNYGEEGDKGEVDNTISRLWLAWGGRVEQLIDIYHTEKLIMTPTIP